MTETISTELPTTRSHPFDPPAELGRLRGEAPISRLRFPDGHLGWLITSYAKIRAILADNRFSSRGELHHTLVTVGDGEIVPPRRVEPGFFLSMDPPDHTRYRKLLTGQFTVRRMNQLTSWIETIAADHLKAMREHGSPIDLIPSFALPVPSLVICELLGVPYDERDRFQRDTAVMLNLENSIEEINDAVARVRTYLRELVVHKRSAPADDLLSGLIASDELDDQELGNIAMLLLIAGHETTANMLGLGTFTLLRHPDQLAALKADPSLVDSTVEELLRYATILQLGTVRTALEDIELDGHLIKAGDTVSLSVSAANRDPDRFADPDRLDIQRQTSGHLGFGHGVHQCLGQQLARIEMRVGFAALFREFPDLRLAVPAEDVPLRTEMSVYGVHSLPVAWS